MSKFTLNQELWFRRWVRLLEVDELSPGEFRRFIREESKLVIDQITDEEVDEMACRIVARYAR